MGPVIDASEKGISDRIFAFHMYNKILKLEIDLSGKQWNCFVTNEGKVNQKYSSKVV